jgi:hypothetical protein
VIAFGEPDLHRPQEAGREHHPRREAAAAREGAAGRRHSASVSCLRDDQLDALCVVLAV